MTPLQTVITAAGDSRSLFLGAGFRTPKSLVERAGRPVIQRAIESYVTDPSSAVVAINADEQREWPIREAIHALNPSIRVVEISSSVKGALVSALMAVGEIEAGSPLIVAAGDSEIVGGISDLIQQLQTAGCDAGTIVFTSQDPRLSYISVDSHDQVVQVTEKRVVGPFATTGVFYFSTGSLFMKAAQWCLVNSASRDGVYYVSTALNFIVNQGSSVGYSVIDPERYLPGSLPVDFVRDVTP
jgi:choline kinase